MSSSAFDQFQLLPGLVSHNQRENIHTALYSECDLEIRFSENHPRFKDKVFLHHPIIFRTHRQTDPQLVASVVQRQQPRPVAMFSSADQASAVPIDAKLTRFVNLLFDAVPSKSDIETADAVCIELYASRQQTRGDFLHTPSMPLDVTTIDGLISKINALRSVCRSSPIGISLVSGSSDPEFIEKMASYVDFITVVGARRNETQISNLHVSSLQSVASAIQSSGHQVLLLADLPLRSSEEVVKCLALGVDAVLNSSVFDVANDSIEDVPSHSTIATLPKLLPTTEDTAEEESFLQTILRDIELHLKTTGLTRLSELCPEHLIRNVDQ